MKDDFDGEFAGMTWAQRFFYSTSFAPINFLFLGGEGELTRAWIADSSMFVNWAREWKASVYALEHRFYGTSELNYDYQQFTHLDHPTLRARLTLLTAEQALADAAVFIEGINKARKHTHPRWIVFGCSYAGNLAAWMRLKYPRLSVRGSD